MKGFLYPCIKLNFPPFHSQFFSFFSSFLICGVEMLTFARKRFCPSMQIDFHRWVEPSLLPRKMRMKKVIIEEEEKTVETFLARSKKTLWCGVGVRGGGDEKYEKFIFTQRMETNELTFLIGPWWWKSVSGKLRLIEHEKSITLSFSFRIGETFPQHNQLRTQKHFSCYSPHCRNWFSRMLIHRCQPGVDELSFSKFHWVPVKVD
jgi:hypothetical protein